MAGVRRKTPPKEKNKPPRVPRDFNEIVRQADAKSIEFFDLINDQTKHQFEFAIILHRILIGAALLVLAISLFIVLFAPTMNTFSQTFSLVGMPVSLLVLLLAYLRNPVSQHRQTFEHLFRLNVAFLNYLHKMQNSKIVVEQTIKNALNEPTLSKLDTTTDEIGSFGEDAIASIEGN